MFTPETRTISHVTEKAGQQTKRNSFAKKPGETHERFKNSATRHTKIELPERSAPNLPPQLKLPSDHVVHPRDTRFTPKNRASDRPPARGQSHCPKAARFEPETALERGPGSPTAKIPRREPPPGTERPGRQADRIGERIRRFQVGFREGGQS